MKKAIIDPLKCNNCEACRIELNCPQKAVIREETAKPWIDFYKCIGCMQCKAYCQNGSVAAI
jgi:Indolepyruvate ferredoxin oxidoreductase, alpha and beta subunits